MILAENSAPDNVSRTPFKDIPRFLDQQGPKDDGKGQSATHGDRQASADSLPVEAASMTVEHQPARSAAANSTSPLSARVQEKMRAGANGGDEKTHGMSSLVDFTTRNLDLSTTLRLDRFGEDGKGAAHTGSSTGLTLPLHRKRALSSSSSESSTARGAFSRKPSASRLKKQKRSHPRVQVQAHALAGRGGPPMHYSSVESRRAGTPIANIAALFEASARPAPTEHMSDDGSMVYASAKEIHTNADASRIEPDAGREGSEAERYVHRGPPPVPAHTAIGVGTGGREALPVEQLSGRSNGLPASGTYLPASGQSNQPTPGSQPRAATVGGALLMDMASLHNEVRQLRGELEAVHAIMQEDRLRRRSGAATEGLHGRTLDRGVQTEASSVPGTLCEAPSVEVRH
ncbi:hypothetical protein BV20DRAFT_982213 [Pilatotrama ljubarskyi]|nr:hypothetical protein BV20DRAFT_982213 [Pilatotrama ljubarskyi]